MTRIRCALPSCEDDVCAHRSAASPELSADLLRAVVDTVSVGIVACDASGRVTLVNETARLLHAVDGDGDLLPSRWAAHPALYEADGATALPASRSPLFRAMTEGVVEDVELVIAPPGLPPRAVRASGRALVDVEGSTVGAVVALADETASRAAERRLRAAHEALTRSTAALARSEAQFRTTFERGPTPMCRLSADGVVLQLNPALRRLIARPTSAIVGRRLSSLVVPADREQVEVALAAAGSPDLDVDLVEVRLRRPDGTTVWCELSVSTAEDEAGDVELLVQLADVDARKRREDDLERRASRDELTGLPNRSALLRALAERLAPGVTTPPPGLLFLDLDGFKTVNDDLGHAVGDEVLVEIAARLRAAVRSTDLVARLGGDEFVVLFERTGGDAEGELADRIQLALSGAVRTSAGPLPVRASVGASATATGEDPGVALARADAAMYASKRRHSRRASPGRTSSLQPRIAELLATAVEEERLDVLYQPVVALATGAVVGVEALLRMRTRSGRVVGPDAFVPVAEATGDIHALGAWVLEQSCAQVAQWKAELPPGAEFALGVNLSPRQLDDAELLGRVDAALARSGLDNDALVLEITERLLTADTDEVRATLAGVRERGVHLACDDFGSGYASLRYLDELPVDVIKIDRSWTRELTGDGRRARLARGVLRLATTTGLVVVAEGIEHEPEREALIAEGCTVGQGWLFARALTAPELSALLAAPPDLVPRQRSVDLVG